jgi:hypothetical protein
LRYTPEPVRPLRELHEEILERKLVQTRLVTLEEQLAAAEGLQRYLCADLEGGIVKTCGSAYRRLGLGWLAKGAAT